MSNVTDRISNTQNTMKVVKAPIGDHDVVRNMDNRRSIEFHLNGSTALTTSDETPARIPYWMDGWALLKVAAMRKSGSGVVTLTLKNGSTSMLTTNITIDDSETDTKTAATPAVIDSSERIVATGDHLWAGCSAAGTSTLNCVVEATFGKVS